METKEITMINMEVPAKIIIEYIAGMKYEYPDLSLNYDDELFDVISKIFNKYKYNNIII